MRILILRIYVSVYGYENNWTWDQIDQTNFKMDYSNVSRGQFIKEIKQCMYITLYLNQLSAYKFGVISHFYKKKLTHHNHKLHSCLWIYRLYSVLWENPYRIFFSLLNIRTFIINSARVHEFTAVVRVFVFSSVHIPIGLSSKCFCWALPRKCVPAWVVRRWVFPVQAARQVLSHCHLSRDPQPYGDRFAWTDWNDKSKGKTVTPSIN